MKRTARRVVGSLLALLAAVAAGGGLYVYVQVRAFDASVAKVHDRPLPAVARSADPAVLARGRHVAEALSGCATRDCHGVDLGGGKTLAMGPLGTMSGPNLTSRGLGAVYSDGELARLVRYGIKKDGRTVLFMPAQDFNWLSDADLAAMISWVRSVPAVERPNGPLHYTILAKVLDRQGKLIVDVARAIDSRPLEAAPAPSPTVEYGRFVARICWGCHGEGFAGGRIPGTPPSFPVPANLTPDETGLKGWSYEDFDRLLTTGTRKNGRQLDPFMPIEAFGRMDDTEKRALFAFLASLPPRPLGQR